MRGCGVRLCGGYTGGIREVRGACAEGGAVMRGRVRGGRAGCGGYICGAGAEGLCRAYMGAGAEGLRRAYMGGGAVMRRVYGVCGRVCGGGAVMRGRVRGVCGGVAQGVYAGGVVCGGCGGYICGGYAERAGESVRGRLCRGYAERVRESVRGGLCGGRIWKGVRGMRSAGGVRRVCGACAGECAGCGYAEGGVMGAGRGCAGRIREEVRGSVCGGCGF